MSLQRCGASAPAWTRVRGPGATSVRKPARLFDSSVLASFYRTVLPVGLLAAFGAWAGTGCTWSNEPDRDLPSPSTKVELLCGNGLDDDEDGAYDCDDINCRELTCCQDLPAPVEHRWPSASDAGGWKLLPSEWIPTTSASGEELVRFPDEPHALLRSECVPLAFGASVTATFELDEEPTDCSEGAACKQFVEFVLTSSLETTEAGAEFDRPLVWRIAANGNAELRLEDRSWSFGLKRKRPYELEVSAHPSTDPDQPGVGIELSVSLSLEGESEFEDSLVLSRDNSESCGGEQGLRVGVSGQGSGVKLGRVRVEPLRACSRQSFVEDDFLPDLTASEDWDLAQIGSPTLASSNLRGTPVQWDAPVQWDVWFEGSGTPRSEEVASYGLWSASVTNREDDDEWHADGKPQVGNGQGPDTPSLREPHVLAPRSDPEDKDQWLLSFAQELGAGEGRFGVEFRRQWLSDEAPAFQQAREAGIHPDQVEDCTSLRDPALLPVDPGLQDGYWLFFTCEHYDDAGIEPRQDIRALRLGPDLGLRKETAVSLVLSDLNEEFGSGGVRAPEPLVAFSSVGTVLRLWFLAESADGETSIGLATAQLDEAVGLADKLPKFEPYPANPVLTERSAPLTKACDGSACRITGFAVAPHAAVPSKKVRFVVAQREDEEHDRFVTFAQKWEIPGMPSTGTTGDR